MTPEKAILHRIGLATTDEGLVDRVGVIVSRVGAKLTVASDEEGVRRLLPKDGGELCLVDLGSVHLLPNPQCADCPILAPPTPDGIILLQQIGGDSCIARRAVSIYDRHELDRLFTDLMRLLPHSDAPAHDSADSILGHTPAISLVREQIRSVARYADVSVLILGETGTGKELVAEAIHELSVSDRAASFIAINCAAIPDNLFESELFGHEAGAYTGARGVRVGLLETAGTGTVFLDEVGEMPLTLQPKLLRVLETKVFRRVGGSRDIPMRARIVSATNRGLGGRRSTLRSDLLYRLAGFTIVLPPLRERADDVDALADSFLAAFSTRHGVGKLYFTDEARNALRAHLWPGNVRELRTVVEHAAILSRHTVIDADAVGIALERQPRARSTMPPSLRVPTNPPMLPVRVQTPAPQFPPESPTTRLRDLERSMIERAFQENEQNLSRTARVLGIPRSTLRDKLRRYGVTS